MSLLRKYYSFVEFTTFVPQSANTITRQPKQIATLLCPLYRD